MTLATNFKYLDTPTQVSFILSILGVAIISYGLWISIKQHHHGLRVILMVVLIILLISIGIRANIYGLI